jgi:D-proline reductase (dithiol) PrdB
MPIACIQRTRERYAKFPPYQWAHHTDAPWAPLARPIGKTRVALLSSGGFYLPGQPPFVEHDLSYRLIPKATDLADLRIFHHGFRGADPDRDPNCVFPLARLRELEARGVIGEPAESAISFVMSYSPRRDVQERSPGIVAALRRMGAEAALCVPV